MKEIEIKKEFNTNLLKNNLFDIPLKLVFLSKRDIQKSIKYGKAKSPLIMNIKKIKIIIKRILIKFDLSWPLISTKKLDNIIIKTTVGYKNKVSLVGVLEYINNPGEIKNIFQRKLLSFSM